MFHRDRIRSISAADKVLEIGPGSQPFPRADVFLDKRFSEEEAFEQSGFAKPVDLQGKPHHYYDGKAFPFGDHEFDYVICSHVIEHVPAEDLPLFISELQRVASKGYLEFPNVFYELINYQPVHQWMMNYRNGEILFLDKSGFHTNAIHQIYRKMFYGKDTYLYKTFTRYKDFFFAGFEWQNTIPHRIVDSFDELVNAQDLAQWSKYFDEFEVVPASPLKTTFEWYYNAVKRRARNFVRRSG